VRELERTFKALGDETRLRLVNLLSRGELCVCELVEVVGELQTKVSRHLAYLKSAGWVEDRRDGQWVFYRLAEPAGEVEACLIRCVRECFSAHPQMAEDLRKLERLEESAELRRYCASPEAKA